MSALKLSVHRRIQAAWYCMLIIYDHIYLEGLNKILTTKVKVDSVEDKVKEINNMKTDQEKSKPNK